MYIKIFSTFTPISLRTVRSKSTKSVRIDEAKRFIVDCLKKLETDEEHANIVADNLLKADSRGHVSHGMNRLEMYLNSICAKQTMPNAKPTVEIDNTCTSVVNGNQGFGAVIGKFCMELAIKKAKKTGIAMVAAYNSNHFGIAAIYVLQAIKEHLVGLSFSNISPIVVPPNALDAALGTNPFSLGAPAGDDSFVLDMAISLVALGKIEIAVRENRKIPPDWAVNDEGEPETDPAKAVKISKLLPLGGLQFGHKGFGIGMLVEIMASTFSGANISLDMPKLTDASRPLNCGQCFIAINPCMFAPGFEQRLYYLLCRIRTLNKKDKSKPILVAGDVEKVNEAKAAKDGIIYSEDQLKACSKLAQNLKVDNLKLIEKDVCD